jgi:hypothetical protein
MSIPSTTTTERGGDDRPVEAPPSRWWILAWIPLGAVAGALVGALIGYATYQPSGSFDSLDLGPGAQAAVGAVFGLPVGMVIGGALFLLWRSARRSRPIG